MYTTYEGARQALSPYDVEGIQSIYGARVPDFYQGHGLATSPSTALDLTPVLNANAQGALAGLSLQTIGDVEYFSVVAPAQTGATLDVAAIAQGFSLLSPKLSVIDPSTGATLAVDSHPNAYGDLAFDSVPGVQAGHRYLIAVTGATNDVFSVGSYGIQLGFFGGTPITPPLDGLPYNKPFALATDLGPNTQPTIFNLTLPSIWNYQLFSFETAQAGPVLVSTLGARVVIGNSIGQVVDAGSGQLGFVAPGAGKYYLIFITPDGNPVFNYAFAVRTFGGGSPAAARPAAWTPPSPLSATIEVDPTGVSASSTAEVVATPSTTVLPRKTSRPTQ